MEGSIVKTYTINKARARFSQLVERALAASRSA
jgi:hypothetical protein